MLIMIIEFSMISRTAEFSPVMLQVHPSKFFQALRDNQLVFQLLLLLLQRYTGILLTHH